MFGRLVDSGNSLIIIEHNMSVISQADYIIDLGPQGGEKGGNLLYEGPLPGLLDVMGSATGGCLKAYIDPSWKDEKLMMKIEDLIKIAENFTEQHPVLPESNLKDLGINSIKCIEMLVEIEDLYGVEFPEDEVKEELFVNVQNIFNTLTRIAQS